MTLEQRIEKLEKHMGMEGHPEYRKASTKVFIEVKEQLDILEEQMNQLVKDLNNFRSQTMIHRSGTISTAVEAEQRMKEDIAEKAYQKGIIDTLEKEFNLFQILYASFTYGLAHKAELGTDKEMFRTTYLSKLLKLMDEPS